MTSALLAEIKLKHHLYRHHMRLKDDTSWRAFTKQRNLTTTLVRKAKSDFVLTTAQETSHDTSNLDRLCTTPSSHHVSPPKLHRMMKSLKVRQRTNIPDLFHNSHTYTTSVDQATALNEFFTAESNKSVGSQDEPVPQITTPAVTDNFLTCINTTPEEVKLILLSLDSSNSSGDDGIPTKLLASVAEEISSSLAYLFSISFQCGELPLMWREATITPLHKKGSTSTPTNYRPISLLSVVVKVQERIVHERLYRHVEKYLPNDQSGFQKKDATEFQLLRLVHEISAAKGAGNAVTACFFDLSKAFDRVWHKGLLKKLEHVGVRGQALAWLRAYLCNRRQRVRVDGSTSPWLPIPAGVPQGLVLGRLLFLVFTFDLSTVCTNAHTKRSQFADDTAPITSHSQLAQAEANLQQSVNACGRLACPMASAGKHVKDRCDVFPARSKPTAYISWSTSCESHHPPSPWSPDPG